MTAPRLSWAEQEMVGETAGTLNSFAALCDHRPDRAEQLRLAAVAGLDDNGRRLLAELAGQLQEAS